MAFVAKTAFCGPLYLLHARGREKSPLSNPALRTVFQPRAAWYNNR